MATKSTRKKTDYDKNQLLEKLEKVATNVAAKKFYTFARNENNLFNLIDYKKDRVILCDIPTEDIAAKICKKYNSNKPYSYKVHNKIKYLIYQYGKLYLDTIYYLRSANESNSSVSRMSARDRYEVTQDRMRETVRNLRSII